MHLTVIESDFGSLPPKPDSWVLRLVGTPEVDEPVPPDIQAMADRAAAQVRDNFPRWLWRWVSEHDALKLEVFSASVSWWWYTPLSEKSALRSPLIREIYWLTLLRIIFQQHPITEVEWFGRDPLLASVAAALAAEARISFHFQKRGRIEGREMTRAIARRFLYLAFTLARWFALKIFAVGSIRKPSDFDIALFTRFPILWEREDSGWRERMFGQWPDYLRRRQHRTVYVAAFSSSLKKFIRERRAFAKQCREQNIVIVDNLVSIFQLLQAHLSLHLFRQYRRWRRRVITQPVIYDGLDVSGIFWREFDLGVLSLELPFDLTIAAGISSAMRTYASIQMIFLPFEYQPMERAVWAGAKSVREVSVIGLQTGLFSSNQMGFSFPVDEMKTIANHELKSPVPDALAAYGELPYRVFSARLGSERVCLSGPIRFSSLRAGNDVHTGAPLVSDAAPSTVFVLLATSIAREESVALLEIAFRAASELPNVFLLIKFHYHLPLQADVERLARRYGNNRYRVFDSDLHDLMRMAAVIICGGSSVGIEAMTLGCMPVVFRSFGEMSFNPMLDTPEAVFFWRSLGDLRTALDSCLTQDTEYLRRKAAWPQAIADHLFDLTVSADNRLYEFLRERKIV
jgi:surface carbohydrate biosynthesis protein (TIGR04326 family)